MLYATFPLILLGAVPGGGITIPVTDGQGGLAGTALLGLEGPGSLDVSMAAGAPYQTVAYPLILKAGMTLRLKRTDTTAQATVLRALAPTEEATITEQRPDGGAVVILNAEGPTPLLPEATTYQLTLESGGRLRLGIELAGSDAQMALLEPPQGELAVTGEWLRTYDPEQGTTYFFDAGAVPAGTYTFRAQPPADIQAAAFYNLTPILQSGQPLGPLSGEAGSMTDQGSIWAEPGTTLRAELSGFQGGPSDPLLYLSGPDTDSLFGSPETHVVQTAGWYAIQVFAPEAPYSDRYLTVTVN